LGKNWQWCHTKPTPLENEKEKKREILRKVKRHPNRTKRYWTEEHEAAIKDYILSSDKEYRSKIYEEKIYPVIKEMIENIVNTFSFGYLPNIMEKKHECLVKITEVLDKFDPNRGFKAFSYFSIATKNWFIIERERLKKLQRTDMSLDDALGNILDTEGVDSHHFISDDTMEKQVIFDEYLEAFYDDFSTWNQDFRIGTNLYNVYNCILELFLGDGLDEIEVIDRRHVYEYIFSKTGLSNNQIANALYRLRRQEKAFNHNWNNPIF
jgi:hypothetical protein